MSDYIVKRLLELIADDPLSSNQIAINAGLNPATFATSRAHWRKGASIGSAKLAEVTEALGYGWIAVPIGHKVVIVPPPERKQTVTIKRQSDSAIAPSQNNEQEK